MSYHFFLVEGRQRKETLRQGIDRKRNERDCVNLQQEKQVNIEI